MDPNLQTPQINQTNTNPAQPLPSSVPQQNIQTKVQNYPKKTVFLFILMQLIIASYLVIRVYSKDDSAFIFLIYGIIVFPILGSIGMAYAIYLFKYGKKNQTLLLIFTSLLLLFSVAYILLW